MIFFVLAPPTWGRGPIAIGRGEVDFKRRGWSEVKIRSGVIGCVKETKQEGGDMGMSEHFMSLK